MIDDEPVEPSTHEPPTERPARATEHVPSRVLVHTGDGKGKSSAAMGVMLRAVSAGWKVAVIQFVKSGKWRTGEEAAGRALGVDWWSLGDGFTWDSDGHGPDGGHRARGVARGGRAHPGGQAPAGRPGRDHLPDELGLDRYGRGRRRPSDLAPHDVSIVATGRDAPAELREVADTVTEMVSEKHAFDEGIAAMRGIEF